MARETIFPKPFQLRQKAFGSTPLPHSQPPAISPTTTGVQPSSDENHLEAALKSLTIEARTPEHIGTHSTLRSTQPTSTMALQRSTQPSGSRSSCLDGTSDEDWAASEPIEDATPSNNTEVFRFMDLPEEMRRLMYSYFLSIPPGEEFQMDQSLVDWSFSTTSAAILKVSKEIYDEAFPVFLRQNRFLIGSSLTSPSILKDFGTKRCAYIRFLSIHFNDRPTNDCIQILDSVNKYCEEIRHLELRVSPGSLILPHLTSMLPSRADARATSRANIVFRCSIRKTDAVLAAEQDIVDTVARRVEKSFKDAFRWGGILKHARDVTVKGCIYKSSLDALEGFAYQGWYLEKTSTLPVLDCSFREEFITRTLKCREEGAGARVGADVED